jgi:serine/threonine protein kinase
LLRNRIKEGKSSELFSFPSDVWSLGVTLVDFLTGQQHHRHLGTESVYEEFKQAMGTNSVELLYPEFWDLVSDLLAWKPESRPTAMQVAQRFPEKNGARIRDTKRGIKYRQLSAGCYRLSQSSSERQRRDVLGGRPSPVLVLMRIAA